MRSTAALLGLFVTGSLAFTACDGDDDTIGTSGGSGAQAGKGGNASQGGTTSASGGEGATSGNGGTSSGKAGTGGKGGSSGTGNSTGGLAGEGVAGASASAGDDGTGGTTGGTAGVGGTIGAAGAGAGGEAGNNGGEAGASGAGPAPTAKACSYECEIDDDCDPAHDYTCVGGLCLDATRACNTRDDCVAWASVAEITSCAQDTDCPYFIYGDLCMNVGGNGVCLTTPSAGVCTFGGEPTVVEKFGLTETATVCLDLSGRCDAKQCFLGCTSDPDFCTLPPNDLRGPVCDDVTGKCGGCTGSGQCYGLGATHCNVATGVCGCQTDNDCDGLAGMDTCVAGKCSCSATSCTTFPDATPICE